MSTRRTSFDKLQRERAKQAKARAKRAKRQSRDEADVMVAEAGSRPAGGATAPELIARLDELHRRYADEQIPFEEFEETRDELLAQLAELPMD